MTTESGRVFATLGEFGAKSRAEMNSLSDSVKAVGLHCRCLTSVGIVIVARGDDSVGSSRGLKLLLGADFGQLMLWSGLQYYFPMSHMAPVWIKTLLHQPESSYYGGVLRSLDDALNSKLDIQPCAEFLVSGDSIASLLPDEKRTDGCLSGIATEVIRSSGIVKTISANSLVIDAEGLQYVVDIGIGAWQDAWAFLLTAPGDGYQEVPGFLMKVALARGASVSGCV